MQIQLKQTEIETAIRNYIAAIGLTMPVGEISFTAARNPSGMTAEVEILESGSTRTVYGGEDEYTPDVQTKPAAKKVTLAGKPTPAKAVVTPKAKPEAKEEEQETVLDEVEPDSVEDTPVKATASGEKKSLFS